MSKNTLVKISKKTNPRIIDLIYSLKELGNQKKVNVWIAIAKKIESSSKNYSSLNLSKINRYTKENEIIIVPGKVLGSGILNHSLTIAALGFSDTAKNKISLANGKYMAIEQLIEQNPNGNGVKIFQ